MKKRVLAGVLWFFAVAYGWNLIALALGLPEFPGYGLGAIAAFLFAADPAGVVWKHDARQPAAARSRKPGPPRRRQTARAPGTVKKRPLVDRAGVAVHRER